MKAFLAYLRQFKKEAVLAPLFKMLEASFELLIPLVVQQIVDVGIAHADRNYTVKMCLVMVALGVIGLVCAVTAQYFSARAAVGVATGLRHSLFTHLQTLSYGQMDKIGTSTMITRMTSDVNQIQNGVNMTLRLFLRSPFIVLGAMIMAFTVDVKGAVIFVVVIPLLSVVVFGIMMITIPLYKKVQEGLDRVLAVTRGNLTGVRVLRAFHKEQEETERFGEENESLTRMQLYVGKISAVMNPATYVIVNIGLVAVLWTGAGQVEKGLLTQGAVMALVNYMSQILVELIKLANLIITINKAMACANRVSDVLQTSTDMIGGSGNAEEIWKAPAKYEVEFDEISLTYPGSAEKSLEGITLQVRPGQTVGIIGGTGSGKTSLIHLISRFYDVTEGQLRVHGVPVQEYDLRSLRSMIGMVPQKAVLFKGTIRDNLRMGKADATEEEMRRALEIAQAAEFVYSKPEGLDAPVSQGGKNLSGGQRQRLTIARALVKRPRILILDDSASALDYATDAALRRAIREMEEKPTLFLVSQRTASLMHADVILVLEDGEAVGLGTHEQLLTECSVYQEIYYSQYPGCKPGEREVQA